MQEESRYEGGKSVGARTIVLGGASSSFRLYKWHGLEEEEKEDHYCG